MSSSFRGCLREKNQSEAVVEEGRSGEGGGGGGKGRGKMSNYAFLNDQLSKRTSIFGLRLWVVLGICVGAAIVIVLFLISLWFTSRRNSSSKSKPSLNPTIPNVSKEIQEIRIDHSRNPTHSDPKVQLASNPEPLPEAEPLATLLQTEEGSPVSGRHRIHIEIGKDHRISYPEKGGGSSHGSGEARSGDQAPLAVPEVSHLGWGHWYTLRELEYSTNGFADENVIGEGGYGIVYRGVLEDNTIVAVKNLLNNRFFSFSLGSLAISCIYVIMLRALVLFYSDPLLNLIHNAVTGDRLRRSLRLKWKQLDVFGTRIWCVCSAIVLKELIGILILLEFTPC